MIQIDGNATIIYKVDEELSVAFESLLQNSALNKGKDKDNGEKNLKRILKDFSSINYYNFNTKIGDDNNNNNNPPPPILNCIYIGKFFLKEQNYTYFYIGFCFVIKNEKNIDFNTFNKYTNKFFKLSEEFKNFKLNEQLLSVLFSKKDLVGLYVRSIKNDDKNKDEIIRKSLELTLSQNIDDCQSFQDEEHIQYINSTLDKTYALEYAKPVTGKDGSFDRVNQFMLAIAYKDYYEKKSYETSKIALQANYSQYNEILEYAEQVAKFEAAYFFKNPTTKNNYEGFFNKFKIKETHDEFIVSLDGLVKYLGILHDKQEVNRIEQEKIERENQIRKEDQIREQEKIERENQIIKEDQIREQEKDKQEEKEKKFTALVGTITGIIAIFTFFADWPSILENASTFNSSILVTWGAFTITVIISFITYKYITKQQK